MIIVTLFVVRKKVTSLIKYKLIYCNIICSKKKSYNYIFKNSLKKKQIKTN